MPSIIEGFEYDIFISYRHKDNEYDHWVTEFVENLRRELRATFKEDISIYFDTNPHDGLLATHDVSDSLVKKLKCLIFIPVISQTYCDPGCFAWKHELMGFRAGAGSDRFNLRVNLANGNVANRVLPVRIHDLDTSDIDLFEREMGFVLRPIDFIYKTSGVNRPLRAIEDNPRENLNHTYYRDQINKVANAVKELVTALKSVSEGRSPAVPASTSGNESKQGHPLPAGSFWKELSRRNVLRAGIAYIVVALLVIQLVRMAQSTFELPHSLSTVMIVTLTTGFPIALIFAWYFEMSPRGLVRINGNGHENPYAPKQKKPFTNAVIIWGMAIIILMLYVFPQTGPGWRPGGVTDKSIAVLPFVNMSNDPEQEYLSAGMMEETLNQLVRIRDLRVVSRTSSMAYRDSKLTLKKIASELGATSVVQGSVQKHGSNLRISIQLIDAITDKSLWSETFDRDMSNIFSIQTEISQNVAIKLRAILSNEEEEQLKRVPTKNSEAYDYYLKGLYYSREYEWSKGIEMHSKAIALDNTFTLAYVERATLNALAFFNKQPGSEDLDNQAKADLAKAIELDPELPEVKICQANTVFYTERNYVDAIRILQGVQQHRPNDPMVSFNLALIQRRMGNWGEAIQNMEKILAIEPSNQDFLFQMARLHSVLRNFPQSIDFFKRVLAIDPEFLQARELKYEATLAWKGDLEEASKDLPPDNEVRTWSTYYYQRKFDQLITMTKASKHEVAEEGVAYKPKSLMLAELYYRKNDTRMARIYGDSAIDMLKTKLFASPADFRVLASLGFAHAFVGNSVEAIEFGKQANDVMPLKLDHYRDGIYSELYLMEIYLLADQYDLAMDKIELLLSVPGVITIPLLQLDPRYDKLRTTARFKKILESNPVTTY